MDIRPSTPNRHGMVQPRSTGGAIGGTPYGCQWRVTEATGYPAFYALGYSSQCIYVVLDLVVVAPLPAAFRMRRYAPPPLRHQERYRSRCRHRASDIRMAVITEMMPAPPLRPQAARCHPESNEELAAQVRAEGA